MKLKNFNPTLLPKMSDIQQQPRVSLHLKSGMFSINGVGCELIGLEKGDQIELYQDEEEPENWYIAKVKEGGWTLNQKGAGSTALFFCNRQACRLMMESVDVVPTTPGVKLPIAGQPTKNGKQLLHRILVIAAKRN